MIVSFVVTGFISFGLAQFWFFVRIITDLMTVNLAMRFARIQAGSFTGVCTTQNQMTGGGHIFRELTTMQPNKIAAANCHRPFRFDLNMKFEHHHSRLSPQPVAVAEL